MAWLLQAGGVQILHTFPILIAWLVSSFCICIYYNAGMQFLRICFYIFAYVIFAYLVCTFYIAAPQFLHSAMQSFATQVLNTCYVIFA